MKANEGNVDRIARITIGLVLLSLVFFGPRTPWGWIGVVPLATGVLGFCPAYVPLRLSTCRRKPR